MTPAVLNAYERVTGKQLTGFAGHGTGGTGGGDWRRGHLSEARRRTLNAKIAAVAVGGPLGEQIGRILDSTGRILAPVRVDDADVAAVEQAAAMCTDLDLRLGGGVADQQARALLRWAAGLLASEASEPVSARLHAAVAALAQRAGWAAFDADSHDVARSLLTIGLYAATRADDPDLRAHLLADLAAQHNHLGYPSDCLQVVRLGEIDERVGPRVRAVMYTVKARAYAGMGDTAACRHHITLAEQAAATGAGETTGWLATIATPAQLAAATGHALAALARRTDDDRARDQARQQLAAAADGLGGGQRRARALCLARLAILHLEATELEPGSVTARQAIEAATGIRSVRWMDHLTSLRTVAIGYPAAADDQPAVKQLTADIDTAILTHQATPTAVTSTTGSHDTQTPETADHHPAAVPSHQPAKVG